MSSTQLDELTISVGEVLQRKELAREFDEAITDLAKAIGMTAIEQGLSAEFAPVVGLLVKTRRVLRAQFGLVA